MDSEESYKERLEQDPGDDCFVDYAEHLRLNKRYPEAINVCTAGLSANPEAHVGRLVLARTFYNSGYISFALREIKELLEACPESPVLKRLAEVMIQDRPIENVELSKDERSEESTVAEGEFDLDDF